MNTSSIVRCQGCDERMAHCDLATCSDCHLMICSDCEAPESEASLPICVDCFEKSHLRVLFQERPGE